MNDMLMIDSRQFAALANAGAVKNVIVVGTNGGFMIKVNEQLIEAKRGHPRIFRKLHTAASFIKDKGIGRFSVEIDNWVPEQKLMFNLEALL